MSYIKGTLTCFTVDAGKTSRTVACVAIDTVYTCSTILTGIRITVVDI